MSQKSERIQWARFFAIILIVLIHSFLSIDQKQFTNFFSFQVALSQVIGRIAVPFLFFLSAYLFYVNTDHGFQTYKLKLKKRLTSLVIPYFAWNIIILLLFFIIQESNYFNNISTGNLKNISEYNVADWLYVFFVRPIANQFWFIRDLILLNLLSYFIVKLIKHVHIIYFACIVFLWISRYDNFLLNIKNEAIVFYSLGIFFSYKNFDIDRFIIKNKLAFFMLSVVYVILLLFLSVQYPFIEIRDYLLLKISIIIGIPIFWTSISYISSCCNKYLSLANYSFIIFAMHIPLNLLIARTMLNSLALTESNCFFIYFVVFVGSIMIPLFIGMFMKKYMTVLYNFLVGYR